MREKGKNYEGNGGGDERHRIRRREACASAGGPMYYTGRNMKTSHRGMKISESDWSIFLQHAAATMEALQVPKQECDEIVAFVLSLKADTVEA